MQVLSNNQILPQSAAALSQIDDSNVTFRQLSSMVRNRIDFSTSVKKQSETAQCHILEKDRNIKPKMFTKLANWMQKLVKETFNFKNQTLEIALRIILSYLQKVNESKSNLQMLGCVALHLASKVNELTIVSIETYVECSMGIFSKEDFEVKEMQVYKTINYEIQTDRIILPLLENLCSEADFSNAQYDRCRNLGNQIIKDPSFLFYDAIVLTINIMAEVKASRCLVSLQDLHATIKKRNQILN